MVAVTSDQSEALDGSNSVLICNALILSETTRGKMKTIVAALITLFALQAHATFIDRAAYLLKLTGTLQSTLSTKDCRALENSDWLSCESNDCKALVFDNGSICDSWECKAITQWNPKSCFSGDCKALVLRDPQLCDSQNCKAITSGDAKQCADPECKTLLTQNALTCGIEMPDPKTPNSRR